MGAPRHEGGWTEPRVAQLKKRWLEGASAAQIARELEGGVTRNAVISKVNRLGLSNRPGPSGAPRASLNHKPRQMNRSPKPAALPAPKGEVKPGTWNGPAGVASPPYKPSKIEGDGPPKNKTLLELGSRECKWPTTSVGTDHRFCGHRMEGDGPYCRGHMRGALATAASASKHSAKELARSLRRYI